jgi:hypothetical protein
MAARALPRIDALMSRSARYIRFLLVFGLYVLLCQHFYVLLDQHICRPVDPSASPNSRLCDVSGPSGSLDLGMESPYWLWLLMLGAPAVVVSALYAGLEGLRLWWRARRVPTEARHGHRRRRTVRYL